MFKCVIVRYTKLPTIAQYKVGSSQRVPPKKKKILNINLKKVINNLSISKANMIKNVNYVLRLPKNKTFRRTSYLNT